MTQPQTTSGASHPSSPSGSTTASPLPSDLSALDVARKAIELAQARPGFVYDPPSLTAWGQPSAAYVHDVNGDQVGGCLFGQALLGLGVPAEALISMNDKGIGYVLRHLDIDTPDTAWGKPADDGVHPFTYPQGEQDVGTPWGSDGVLGALVRYVEAAQ